MEFAVCVHRLLGADHPPQVIHRVEGQGLLFGFGSGFGLGGTGGAAAGLIGLVAGIGCGQAGVGILLEAAEFGQQLGGALGFGFGEVVLLADVLGEVEEFDALIIQPLDEFPVASADGGRGRAALIAVVGVMPKERTLWQVTAFEHGHEAAAIEFLAGLWLGLGGFEQGGEEIGAADRGADDGAGFDDGGPAHDEGLADAAFIHPAFAAAQREVGGGGALAGGEAAVVAGEDDEGVLTQTEFVEFGEDFADGEVHGLDHSGVDGVFLDEADFAGVFFSPGGFEAEALAFLLIFLFQIGSRLQRGVDGVEGEVGEETTVFVGFDESASLRGEAIWQVLAFWAVGQAGVVIGDKVFAAPIRAAAIDAAEVVIEALIFWPETLGAEMPFASEEGGVTGGFHGLGQGGRVECEAVGVGGGEQRGVAFPFVWLGGTDVVGDAGAGGPLASHDAGASGGADGAGGVAIRKQSAVFGHLIDIGRLVKRAAVAPEVALAEVIDQEEDDVGRGGGSGGELGES
jgi:hypothetical protein